MSKPSLENIIVEHGLESSYFDGVAYCYCGAKRVVVSHEAGRQWHASHVADMIREHWHIVERVAPDAAGNFPTLGKFPVELIDFGRYSIRYGGEFLTRPAYARSTAAALLSAADVAEQTCTESTI